MAELTVNVIHVNLTSDRAITAQAFGGRMAWRAPPWAGATPTAGGPRCRKEYGGSVCRSYSAPLLVGGERND
jgi:hypothetical protein